MFRFVFNFLAAKVHISFHSAKFYRNFFTIFSKKASNDAKKKQFSTFSLHNWK